MADKLRLSTSSLFDASRSISESNRTSVTNDIQTCPNCTYVLNEKSKNTTEIPKHLLILDGNEQIHCPRCGPQSKIAGKWNCIHCGVLNYIEATGSPKSFTRICTECGKGQIQTPDQDDDTGQDAPLLFRRGPSNISIPDEIDLSMEVFITPNSECFPICTPQSQSTRSLRSTVKVSDHKEDHKDDDKENDMENQPNSPLNYANYQFNAHSPRQQPPPLLTERCAYLKRLCVAQRYFKVLAASSKIDDVDKKSSFIQFNEEVYSFIVDDTAHLVSVHGHEVQQIWSEWVNHYGFPKCTISGI